MPDRFLRAGLIKSDRYHGISLDARDLFIRLIILVDDFGCFDGRDHVIAHQAYYHGRQEPLTLNELHIAGLIVRYTNAGKPFIALAQWGEQLRLRRLYPAPPVNVDSPDVTVRGKFGRPISWKNPPGSDPVSILLDTNGRPVAPQPQEWRRVNEDWMPLDRPPTKPKDCEPVIAAPSQSLPQGTEEIATTGVSALPQVPVSLVQQGTEHPVPQVPFGKKNNNSYRNVEPITRTAADADVARAREPQPLAAQNPAAATTIELGEQGVWQGLAETQVERWQGMFPGMAVPDQLERAAAWLEQHQGERDAIAAQGAGFGQFLIRWLLREARPNATGHAT